MSDELNPEIRISVIADTERGKQSMAAIQQLVAGARAEVEKFAQSGGLERLGKGNLDAAVQRIDELETTLVSSERKMQLLDQAIATVGEDSPALDGLIDRFDELQKSTQSAVEELIRMPDALEESAQAAEALNNRQTGRVRTSADTVGGFERPLAQIAGSIGAFGGNTEIANALRLGSEVSGSIEALGRMGESIKDLTSRAAASSVALSGIGLAVTGITILARDSKKNMQEFIQAQEAARQRTIELREQIEQLSSRESIEQLKAENAARRAALVDEIDAIQQEIAQMGNTKARDFFNVDESSFGKPAALLFDALGINADEAQQKLKQLNEELKTLDDSTAQLSGALAEVAIHAQEATTELLRQLEIDQQRQLLIDTANLEDLNRLREESGRDLTVRRRNLQGFQDQAINDLVESVKKSTTKLTTTQAQEFYEALQIEDPDEKIAKLQELINLYNIALPSSVQNSVKAYEEQIAAIQKDKENLDLYRESAVEAAAAQRTVSELIPTMRDFFQVMFTGQTTEEQRKASIEATTKANEEAIAAETKHAQALLDDAAKTSQSIAQLEKSRADQLAKQQQADAEAAVIAGFRSQIDAAKAAEAERTRADKITALRQDEQAQEIEALQKHEADKAKAQAAFDLAQRRKQEDLADDLNEAAADRDVRAFLRIQKQGEKELRRTAEDNDLRQKEQDAALSEQIRELRKDANERIRVERDSGQRRITQVQRLEQQLADYQVSLARQRQQQERQIQAQSYQEQITAWRTHLNQVSQELMTGLVSPLRGALGLIGGNAVAPLPVGANVGASALRGGAGVSVAITIQQQNNGRFASAEDLVRVENNNRTMLQAVAQTVTTAVQRARANTGGR